MNNPEEIELEIYIDGTKALLVLNKTQTDKIKALIEKRPNRDKTLNIYLSVNE